MEPESTQDECIRQVLHLMPPGCYRVVKRFLLVLVNCSKLAEVRLDLPLVVAMRPQLLRSEADQC